ncbi:Flagellin [Anaerohalosphaera lusitana]|uniref:Flagellin n=1 Tax=Anaerohalosphaera lusitana TaxID=1936003 RepID=A0A1U9NGE5_9BACT|nr:flagellin [Anaerohalosphaera lusitana]AQT66885.1 Flagellin [Anaerohalosphaera lusitana]
MLAIKNNLMATNAARHLGQSYDNLSQSVERLSSGLRINGAKDDAAGMAVRELMRADIAVLDQAGRNAQDGISMLQTMEGAMAVMDENLIRMKELAEQAATGSYSNEQRAIMNNEFKEMANEIERIASSTSFNGLAMLNTDEGNVSVHVGTEETIDVDKVDMTKSGLGIDIATAGYQAESDHTVTDTDTTSFLTLTGGTNESMTLNIQFDGEDAVTATFAGPTNTTTTTATFTLDDVVSAVNTAAGYTMASAEDDGSGNYSLKLESETLSSSSMTMTATTEANVAASEGFTVAGGTTDDDLTTADFTAAAGDGIHIGTEDGAVAALTAIDSAIKEKDTARAAFGYKMNRLESTNSVLNIQSENLKTAESRISDVDVATEMAKMTRNQVLAQAGVSMLAQANGMPQMAMSLLR